MQVEFIGQSHEILHVFGGIDTIAEAARTCYASEAKDEGADERLVRSLIKNGHDAMLEFAWMTVRIVCDRGISHELVRHRLFSFAMESQRYCNYNSKGIRFIVPNDDDDIVSFYMTCRVCEECAKQYESMTATQCIKPEIARYALPNATATTLEMAGNVRQWRTTFKLRCDRHAHPMMRKLMLDILADAKEQMPVVFDDLEFD